MGCGVPGKTRHQTGTQNAETAQRDRRHRKTDRLHIHFNCHPVDYYGINARDGGNAYPQPMLVLHYDATPPPDRRAERREASAAGPRTTDAAADYGYKQPGPKTLKEAPGCRRPPSNL